MYTSFMSSGAGKKGSRRRERDSTIRNTTVPSKAQL